MLRDTLSLHNTKETLPPKWQGSFSPVQLPAHVASLHYVRNFSAFKRQGSSHPYTKRWKELYNERTSVERCNSRLKTYLTADAMHVWGIQKVTTHQYLNAVVLLASAIAMACQSKKTAA
jgi:hypothetical protein